MEFGFKYAELKQAVAQWATGVARVSAVLAVANLFTFARCRYSILIRRIAVFRSFDFGSI